MKKFVAFFKNHIFNCLSAIAIAIIAAILAATSREHSLLIAIFLGFTPVAFLANSIGYDGSHKLAHVWFALLAVMCFGSMFGIFIVSLTRSQHWQQYLAILMTGINLVNFLGSAKIIQKIVRNQGRADVLEMVRQYQQK
jgi:hypothetical protein